MALYDAIVKYDSPARLSLQGAHLSLWESAGGGKAWGSLVGGIGIASQPVLRSLSAFVVIASAVALADRCWLRARGYLRAGLPFKEDGEAEGAENGRAVR